MNQNYNQNRSKSESLSRAQNYRNFLTLTKTVIFGCVLTAELFDYQPVLAQVPNSSTIPSNHLQDNSPTPLESDFLPANVTTQEQLIPTQKKLEEPPTPDLP